MDYHGFGMRSGLYKKINKECMMTEGAKEKRGNMGGKAGLIGPLWFIGWLFTIGFADLTFWKAVLALILWPFYLGNAL